MRKHVSAFVIEELPQHVNGEKRIFIFRAIIIDKPLKALDLITTVILDKIKHAPLVGVKSR